MTTVPAVTPLTTPPEVTVALAGVPLLQAPPADVSVNVIVPPMQTTDGPPIGAAETPFTVTIAVTEQAPPTV